MSKFRLVAVVLVAFLAAGTLAKTPGPEAGWVTLATPAQAPARAVWTPEAWMAHRASSSPPEPGVQSGIGPGSAMHQGVGQADYICTAAFLLRDPFTGTYYLSTAGHCLVRDAADPTPYTGAADADKLDDVIEVCVADCLDNALGLGDYVRIEPEDGIHPVTFAQSGGVGLDFGIIQLPAALHGDLRPHMPMWGGPTGLAGNSDGSDTVVFYGHGSYCCPGVGAVASRTPADQGRTGVYQGAGSASWEALGWSSGGDSGSGVSLGVAGGADGLAGGKALGVLTHGTYIFNEAASVPIFTGTVLTKGLEMVREATGLQLELVLAGDPLPQAPTAVQQPFNVTVTSPSDGSTVSLASKRVPVSGTAGKAGEGLPEGTKVQLAVDDPDFRDENRIPIVGNTTWNGKWDLAGVAAGTHVLRARIVDEDGTVLDQTNVTVTLTSGPAPSPGAGPSGSSTGGSTKATTGTDASGEGDDAKGPIPGVDTPAPSWLIAALAVSAIAAVLRRRA